MARICPTEIWDCAMQSFNVENCATQTVVQDKKNLNKLASYCVTKLTKSTAVVGVEIMLSGFSGCVGRRSRPGISRFRRGESSRLPVGCLRESSCHTRAAGQPEAA